VSSRHHPSRSWVKNLHAQIRLEIPDGWRIVGENVYAKHSIHYTGLPSYFFVFAVFDEHGVSLPWGETVDCATGLGLSKVPVLRRGKFDCSWIRDFDEGRSQFGDSEREGYVVRRWGSISPHEHHISVAKYVRAGHVQTDEHWMRQQIVPNELTAKTRKGHSDGQ